MKKQIEFLIAIAVVVILAGCGATTREITRMGQSERADVFIEVPKEEAASAGFVDLVIKATIKTSLKGYYLLGSKAAATGYTFLINIDGQAVQWKADGNKESIPLYDERGRTSRDPEAGEGIKYILERKIRLAAGPHRIVFAPGEAYLTVVEVSLKEGGPSIVEFKPLYRYKTTPTRIPTFLRGINHYDVLLNGLDITHGRSGT